MAIDGANHPVRSFLVGMLSLATLGYGAYWIISRLLTQLTAVTSDLGKAIVAAGATVVVATISLVFGKIWEQRVKLQEDVRQRKLPTYEAHVQFMFKTIFDAKDGSLGASEEDIRAAFRNFTAQILVWGGPGVIKAWTAYRLHDWVVGGPIQGFQLYEDFIKAIRSELGNQNSNLAKGDLLKLFINDYDVDKLRTLERK